MTTVTKRRNPDQSYSVLAEGREAARIIKRPGRSFSRPWRIVSGAHCGPMDHATLGEAIAAVAEAVEAAREVTVRRADLRSVLEELGRLGIQLGPRGEVTARLRRAVRGGEAAQAGDPIEDLGLAERPYNILRRNQVFLVGQLQENTTDDLMAMTNMGERSLTNINECLEASGLDRIRPGTDYDENGRWIGAADVGSDGRRLEPA